MIAKCVRRFRDIEAGTFREVGATFDVTEERFEAINSAGYGQLVEEVKERPSEAVSEPQKATQSKPAPKRRTRAKKTVTPQE